MTSNTGIDMADTTNTIPVFLSEEFSYRCYVFVLENTTLEEIKEWWQEKKGDYRDPLPGETRRADILWGKDMNPESGWKPVDETWPRVGDVFHLLDRKAHTYDPTDYVMPEGAVFIHTHMDDDSFLRLPDGTEILHPDHDPDEEDEDWDDDGEGEIEDGDLGMLAWGMTTETQALIRTFNTTHPTHTKPGTKARRGK